MDFMDIQNIWQVFGKCFARMYLASIIASSITLLLSSIHYLLVLPRLRVNTYFFPFLLIAFLKMHLLLQNTSFFTIRQKSLFIFQKTLFLKKVESTSWFILRYKETLEHPTSYQNFSKYLPTIC